MIRFLTALLFLTACTSEPATAPVELLSTQPWTRHTISAAYVGADGHALGDVDQDGDADIVVAWEQSARVSIHARPCDPRQPWPEVADYAHAGVEDVALCDLDGDGWRDVVSAGQDRKLRVAFGPTFAPVAVVASATNVQQWLQVVCGDLDGDGAPELVAGGRVAYPATVSSFASATPRDGASWTRTVLGPAGWTMTLAVQDVDADGLPDVVTTDRSYATPGPPPTPRDYSTQGARYLTRASGTWASVTLGTAPTGYTARIGDRRPGTGALLWGAVHDASGASALWLDGVALPYPSATGPYQAARLVDIDADGDLDVLLSAGETLDPLASGVVALLAPGWTRQEISGPGPGKWDEVEALDVDADGDIDVVTTEQHAGHGAVWYEQP